MRWLLLGLVIPAPLFVGALLLAHFHRDPPPAEFADGATTLSSAAPARTAGAQAPRAFTAGEALCPAAVSDLPPIVLAAACGNLAQLAELVAAGGGLADTDPRAAFRGRSPLHHACSRGDLAAAKLLLDAGAQADLPDAGGNTPLHLLAVGDKVVLDETIALNLIRAGADIGRRNSRGFTALEELESDHAHVLASQALARLLHQTENQLAMLRQAETYLNQVPGSSDASEAIDIVRPAPDAYDIRPRDPGDKLPAER